MSDTPIGVRFPSRPFTQPVISIGFVAGLCWCLAARADQPPATAANAAAVAPSTSPGKVRIATFNVSLYRSKAGQLAEDLANPDFEPARQVAAILQLVRPDVVLLCEFDYDAAGVGVQRFQDNFLSRSQHGEAPIQYEHTFIAPVNTGEPSGIDLNRDDRTDGPNDAYGFGRYPGQYGLAVLSRFPIDREAARTFQKLLWKDMPGALLPTDPATQTPYYGPDQWAAFRLSSKSHLDVPLRIGDRVLHLLASHPTPPAFDGPEDRNGRRNHDEIRLWADYLTPDRSSYLRDDSRRSGGLPEEASFVIAGDLNADPHDGGSVPGAIQQLLDHPRVQQLPIPESRGATAASAKAGGPNERHRGEPQFDTADFGSGPGNLRVDYVLPSRDLKVTGGGVFWPAPDEPHADLIAASDHRLVWIDIER